MLLKIQFLSIDTGFGMPGNGGGGEIPDFLDFESTLPKDRANPDKFVYSFVVTVKDSLGNPFNQTAADTSQDTTMLAAVGYSSIADESYVQVLGLDIANKDSWAAYSKAFPGDAGFTSVVSNPDGSIAYFAAPNENTGMIGVYNTATENVTYVDPETGAGSAKYIGRSPDYQVLIAAGENGVSFFDIRDGGIVKLHTTAYFNHGTPTDISSSQNGDRVVVAFDSGTFMIFYRETNDWGNGTESYVPDTVVGSYLSAQINAGGTSILIGQPDLSLADNGHVYVYDMQTYYADPSLRFTFTGREVLEVAQPGSDMDRPRFGSGVVMSNDQKLLMMLDSDGTFGYTFSRSTPLQFNPTSERPVYHLDGTITDPISDAKPSVHLTVGEQYMVFAHPSSSVMIFEVGNNPEYEFPELSFPAAPKADRTDGYIGANIKSITGTVLTGATSIDISQDQNIVIITNDAEGSNSGFETFLMTEWIDGYQGHSEYHSVGYTTFGAGHESYEYGGLKTAVLSPTGKFVVGGTPAWDGTNGGLYEANSDRSRSSEFRYFMEPMVLDNKEFGQTVTRSKNYRYVFVSGNDAIYVYNMSTGRPSFLQKIMTNHSRRAPNMVASFEGDFLFYQHSDTEIRQIRKVNDTWAVNSSNTLTMARAGTANMGLGADGNILAVGITESGVGGAAYAFYRDASGDFQALGELNSYFGDSEPNYGAAVAVSNDSKKIMVVSPNSQQEWSTVTTLTRVGEVDDPEMAWGLQGSNGIPSPSGLSTKAAAMYSHDSLAIYIVLDKEPGFTMFRTGE